mgnify:CR=1 FL=1|tara:strand:+ start:577 stop:1509 length:933 start_codon:yes stop_codon:yes gene_type:complete
MTLNYKQLREHVQLSVGGDPSTVGGGTTTVNDRIAQIVNYSGEHLFSRGWRFRERTSAGLTIETAENTGSYVDLPADCGEIISAEPSNSWSSSLSFVDPATFQRISTAGIEPELSYIVTLVFAVSSGVLKPRLDIYPAAPVSTTATFNVRYRANWTSLTAAELDGTDTTNLTNLPPYVEALLMEYIRAFAEGGEDGTTHQRLAMVDTGILLDRALRKDGTFAPDYGQLPAAGNRGTGQTYAAGTVSAPDPSNLVWRGTWDNSTNYTVNDIVHYAGTAHGGAVGSSQICIQAALGSSQSPAYNAYWDIFST